MASVVVELELHERLIEEFLAGNFGSKTIPSDQKIAHLRMLVIEYLEWYERSFGQQPKIHPIRNRLRFLQMRKRKSKIPISAVA